jgi:hypothetical protein
MAHENSLSDATPSPATGHPAQAAAGVRKTRTPSGRVLTIAAAGM